MEGRTGEKCPPNVTETLAAGSSSLKSVTGYGFRARNGELKGSGVLGSEGDNSPFRGARSKLTPQFLGTHGYSWANLPNRTVFRPKQQAPDGPKYTTRAAEQGSNALFSVQNKLHGKLPACTAKYTHARSCHGCYHGKLYFSKGHDELLYVRLISGQASEDEEALCTTASCTAANALESRRSSLHDGEYRNGKNKKLKAQLSACPQVCSRNLLVHESTLELFLSM